LNQFYRGEPDGRTLELLSRERWHQTRGGGSYAL